MTYLWLEKDERQNKNWHLSIFSKTRLLIFKFKEGKIYSTTDLCNYFAVKKKTVWSLAIGIKSCLYFIPNTK